MATSLPSQTIPLWPNGAPGSEDWTQSEQEAVVPESGLKVVWNVAQPSLTSFLPPPDRATGTAVIVCPGGAFHFLAIKHEGTDVAQWLVERGVAAFVLRYRLLRAPDDVASLTAQVRENLADRSRMAELVRPMRPLILADGQEAIRLVRQRSSEWGVEPNRIGLIGFSAGGTVTTGVALQHDAASRPDFVAPIYSAPWEDLTVPADAAPMFIALANDDEMAVRSSLPLYSAWRAAGHPSELHIFSRGGHGFGMRQQGLPSDHWIDLFGDWLKVQGLLARPG
jgi:acetyl esterase/lipase